MAIASESLLQVKTIDHVTIVVKDLERSAQFYHGILGMTPIERPAFGFPGLWFQAGKTQIHMNVEGDDAGRAGFGDLGAKSPSRGFHFAFEVDDCDQAAEKLREKGIEIVVGPKSRPDGPRQLYIHDPDGHLVELFSFLK